MTSPKNNNELETITFVLKKGSPLAERLQLIRKGLDKLNPSDVYGRDRLTIDQMTTSQEEAFKKGHSHFFDGRICRNGHIAPRTKRGECNQCTRESANRSAKKKKKRDLKKRKKFSR